MAILDSDSDSSSGSSSTEEDVGDNTFAKKRLTPSQSDSQEQGLEVPEELFNCIQEALALRKQLVTNKNYEDLIEKLRLAEHKMEDVSELFKINRLLPSDWTYNPATDGTYGLTDPQGYHVNSGMVRRRTKGGGRRTKGGGYDYRRPFGWNGLAVNPGAIEGSKVSLEFTYETVKDGLTDPQGYYENSGMVRRRTKGGGYDYRRPFGWNGLAINHLILYVNKDNNKNLSDARFMECKYLKFKTSYLFYMTIEAIEQGNLGVYKAAVEFESDDGARALDMFVLTNHEPSGAIEGSKVSLEFTYETVKDGLTDPQDYYVDSGMVRRRTKGGGYDYRRPFGWNGWCAW